jgi:uncharacterized Tic20 family protein
MIKIKKFVYEPLEYEIESASNCYLISLITSLFGLPLPIVNFIAAIILFISNRNSTVFVRWHCMQAILFQLSLLIVNSVGLIWTIFILLSYESISNKYFAYMITAIIFNFVGLIKLIYIALQTRKGHHTEWFFYGTLTNFFYKSKL